MRRAAHVAFAALASLALLAGCGPSGHADLDAWMKEQGKNARGKLDPLPEIKPYEPFAYNDFDLPDPFKPRKIEPAKGESTSKLAPARHATPIPQAAQKSRFRSCRESTRKRTVVMDSAVTRVPIRMSRIECGLGPPADNGLLGNSSLHPK